MIEIAHERMSAEFEKFHLGNGDAIHHFTAPDAGGPHDHPWPFRSTVLAGGYVERVYRLTDAGWTSELLRREPGDTFEIAAEHIHEIVELPCGECWTVISAGPAERESRFWRFDQNGAASRAWHESEYR